MSAAQDPPSPASVVTLEDAHHSRKPKETFWRKIVNWMTATHDDDKGKWLEDMRGMLSLASTMIATITFQSSINPPGGVLPAGEKATLTDLQACVDDDSRSCAGEAILPIIYTNDYQSFQVYNTIAFVASLSVTLLLVSGLPLKSRFPIWMLSIGMICTLTFLAFAYLYAMLLVTPTPDGPWRETVNMVRRTVYIWFALVGTLALCLTVRFFAWLLSEYINRFKYGKATAPRN